MAGVFVIALCSSGCSSRIARSAGGEDTTSTRGGSTLPSEPTPETALGRADAKADTSTTTRSGRNTTDAGAGNSADLGTSTTTTTTRLGADTPATGGGGGESETCPNVVPSLAALTFLVAAEAGDKATYRQCVLPPESIEGILDATVSSVNVVGAASMLLNGDFTLDDMFERRLHTFPDVCCTFSYGSPDLPPDSNDANMHYVDPNGRADITVRTGPDGRYYVVAVGIEFHG